MIELTCTKCKTVLSIDDAFAGGVCRCKHCGTIQTVPKLSKRAAIPASVAANGRPDTVNQATSAGTGLDELAQVVASSGLSGSGLRSSRLRKPAPDGTKVVAPAPAATKRPEMTLILAIGGAIVVLLGIIIAILLSNRNVDKTTAVQRPPASVNPTPKAGPTNPHFLGMPIHSTSIIFVLDRGSGTADVFDMMRVAVQNSLATLPPTTRFQIVFWETGTLTTIPASGMQPATKEHVAAAQRALGDVYAFGQSKVEPALGKALSQNPSDILLATGKVGLDDEFTKTVVGLRRDRPVKIHAFSLGDGGSPEALKAIARQTGGEFREVGVAELRGFAE